ncbi:hypothetical protein [Cohnella abietis]|uniref:Uncharacterized protein n=1 Tax=Cohnella abietis TaxID=2507935 RepID=A0A3T1D872_9BACL|nr:hypothetical protein [Cohnella abietis]BBI34263.1 hypothetical protein KCTCHS21_36620 [Cohnella abietis]
MVNKMILSLAAVLLGFVSLGFIHANTSDYTPVPRNSQTQASYIDQIYQQDGKTYIKADFIEWYEGEEANKVFREKEQDPDMTEAPDGYYIVNDDTQLQTLEVADDVKIYMQIYNRTGKIEEATTNWNEQIDLSKFLTLLSDSSEMNLKDYPYHLTIENNKITKIVQQFIP